MSDIVTSASDWWEARRLRYNVGLVFAGILAFIAYAVVCSSLLPEDANVEITLFATLCQGIGYSVMIGVANLCYFIGPLSEHLMRPMDAERHRVVCYRLGFWFSVLLPLSIPVLLATLAIFHPAYWNGAR